MLNGELFFMGHGKNKILEGSWKKFVRGTFSSRKGWKNCQLDYKQTNKRRIVTKNVKFKLNTLSLFLEWYKIDRIKIKDRFIIYKAVVKCLRSLS